MLTLKTKGISLCKSLELFRSQICNLLNDVNPNFARVTKEDLKKINEVQTFFLILLLLPERNLGLCHLEGYKFDCGYKDGTFMSYRELYLSEDIPIDVYMKRIAVMTIIYKKKKEKIGVAQENISSHKQYEM
ncbi:unnamed protein product [Brachionus calyciflorus]|uniref:Uncharacterized protein n=1 Tax=Brachionus calyciflorus TaxID=104777 RepID=A0A814E517_9BILA|nr:unnamed protein product [Brachionus calyciflorus]